MTLAWRSFTFSERGSSNWAALFIQELNESTQESKTDPCSSWATAPFWPSSLFLEDKNYYVYLRFKPQYEGIDDKLVAIVKQMNKSIMQ